MPAIDVILSWFASSPALVAALSGLQRPYKLIEMPVPEGQHYLTSLKGFGWPHPLRGVLQHFGVTEPLRVAAMGFSEGCQGVRALLASADAGYVEHVFGIDGIHCGWVGGSPNVARDNICCPGFGAEQNCIGNWTAYADLAARGNVAVGGNPPAPHFCSITHSSIVPPGFPSTTETAAFILNKLFGSGWPVPQLPDGILDAQHNPPVTLNSHGQSFTYDHAFARYMAGQHGLAVIGYDNHDPRGYCDHIYQAHQVLPLLVSKLLVPRWNSVDPNAASCTSGTVAGAQCNPNGVATVPPGYMQAPDDASLDPSKFSSPLVNEPSVWSRVGSLAFGAAVTVGVAELLRWGWRRKWT